MYTYKYSSLDCLIWSKFLFWGWTWSFLGGGELVVVVFGFFFFFWLCWDMILLCCPGWTGSHYVAQVDFKMVVSFLHQLLQCWALRPVYSCWFIQLIWNCSVMRMLPGDGLLSHRSCFPILLLPPLHYFLLCCRSNSGLMYARLMLHLRLTFRNWF